jgi:hypothetical protein
VAASGAGLPILRTPRVYRRACQQLCQRTKGRRRADAAEENASCIIFRTLTPMQVPPHLFLARATPSTSFTAHTVSPSRRSTSLTTSKRTGTECWAASANLAQLLAAQRALSPHLMVTHRCTGLQQLVPSRPSVLPPSGGCEERYKAEHHCITARFDSALAKCTRETPLRRRTSTSRWPAGGIPLASSLN